MTDPAGEWIKKAQSDLLSAKALLSLNEGFYDQICFLSQQSAEKFLKGYLTKKNCGLVRTHDLVKLTTDCSNFNINFREWEDTAFRLTLYAVDFRYPGEEATKEEAIEAYNLAEEFSRFLEEELNK